MQVCKVMEVSRTEKKCCMYLDVLQLLVHAFMCLFFLFFFVFFLSCVLKETCQETSRGAAIEGACFRAVFSGSPFSKTTGKNKHAASLTMLDLGGDRPTLDSKAVFAYRSSLGFRSRA